MNKLELKTTVIVRSPRFSYETKLNDCWQELKLLINEASPDFYERIGKLSFDDLQCANQKIKDTVYKYFNRSKFRSTPFGSFASLSTATLADVSNELILEEIVTAHRFQSWKHRNSNVSLSEEECQTDDVKFFSNTSFYRVGDQIRYLKRVTSTFTLAAIDYDAEIETILLFCCRARNFEEIKNLVPTLDETTMFELLKELIDVELILTSKHGNIIGEDYLNKIRDLNTGQHQSYIISERKTQSGSIHISAFKHLPELALKIQQLNSSLVNETFENFITSFNKKFEGQEVPILVVLDPEIGISYGNLAHRDNDDLFVNFERKNVAKASTKQEGNSDLFKLIIDAINNNSAIQLENINTGTLTKNPLPNTISILCTQIDEKVLLDSMGGVTSNALAGRFANTIPGIKQYCEQNASLESTSNSDILFFDIGYSHEGNADDINRRPSIYPYQLNILNYDTSLLPLRINDIFVSIRNGEVVLRSASLNKRVIPRYASAYNYSRSDLPLFRFLMDLQGQGLSTNLSWRPINIIPDLEYYPRVEFRNIIVAPATWLLKMDIFKGCVSIPEEQKRLVNHLDSLTAAQYFKTGIADQTLFINKRCCEDIGLLLTLLKKEKSLYIEEAILPKKPNTKDNSGNPLLPQFNLTLQHTEPVYKEIDFTETSDKSPMAKQWIAPGREWLYYEIFGEPYLLDKLLDEKLTTFIRLKRHKIEKWFFIRYNENGEHIRLRIKIKRPGESFLFMNDLSRLLEEELNSGAISEINIRTYKKEIHRYSENLMDRVEQHFTADSEYVMAALSNQLTEMQKCNLCIKMLSEIRNQKNFPQFEFDHIVERMKDSFNKEYNIENSDFKEINKLYKLTKKEPHVLFPKKTLLLFEGLLQSFCDVIFSAERTNRAQLFTDLFHMHVNRSFVVNQRFKELLIYNFFHLDLIAEQKRKKSGLSHVIRA